MRAVSSAWASGVGATHDIIDRHSSDCGDPEFMGVRVIAPAGLMPFQREEAQQ